MNVSFISLKYRVHNLTILINNVKYEHITVKRTRRNTTHNMYNCEKESDDYKDKDNEKERLKALNNKIKEIADDSRYNNDYIGEPVSKFKPSMFLSLQVDYSKKIQVLLLQEENKDLPGVHQEVLKGTFSFFPNIFIRIVYQLVELNFKLDLKSTLRGLLLNETNPELAVYARTLKLEKDNIRIQLGSLIPPEISFQQVDEEGKSKNIENKKFRTVENAIEHVKAYIEKI